MKALALRSVTPRQASATRALGAGQRLPFEVGGEYGELLLLPDLAPLPAAAAGTWFTSAAGPLYLTDAEALLSLLSEIPLCLEGEQSAWYWQLFNQNLSPEVASWLSPLERCAAPEQEPAIHCRVQARLAEQVLHACLQASPATLLAMLDAGPWQALERPLDDDLQVTCAVVAAELSLTLEQIASLRPGDVLLPTLCHFIPQGQGQLTLAGRRWSVQAQATEHRLRVQLSHEEYSDDEY